MTPRQRSVGAIQLRVKLHQPGRFRASQFQRSCAASRHRSAKFVPHVRWSASTIARDRFAAIDAGSAGSQTAPSAPDGIVQDDRAHRREVADHDRHAGRQALPELVRGAQPVIEGRVLEGDDVRRRRRPPNRGIRRGDGIEQMQPTLKSWLPDNPSSCRRSSPKPRSARCADSRPGCEHRFGELLDPAMGGEAAVVQDDGHRRGHARGRARAAESRPGHVPARRAITNDEDAPRPKAALQHCARISR